jgi:putative ABC transport system permease protein
MGQGGAAAGGVVVGVAPDVRDYGPEVAPRPTVYLSHSQFPMGFMTVTVRTVDGKPERVLEPLRAAVADLDPDLPMFRVRTMEQIAADTLAQPRVYLMLLALFAATALLLAAIGIYGVTAYTVTRRTREIGVRLAMGATRSDVLLMVLKQGMSLVVIGSAIGLVLAAGSTRVLVRLLFGVPPLDTLTFTVAGILLSLIGLAACYFPARRATRINPVEALRYE